MDVARTAEPVPEVIRRGTRLQSGMIGKLGTGSLDVYKRQGLTGVWFGMFVDWICRSILFGVRFYSGKWMEHKVI